MFLGLTCKHGNEILLVVSSSLLSLYWFVCIRKKIGSSSQQKHFDVNAMKWVNSWEYPRKVHYSSLGDGKEFIHTVENLNTPKTTSNFK